MTYSRVVPQTFGLETYGISVTTMEEVFLKVAEHGDDVARKIGRARSGSRSLRDILGEAFCMVLPSRQQPY